MPDCANFGVEKLRGLRYTEGPNFESTIEMAGQPYNSAALQLRIIRMHASVVLGHTSVRISLQYHVDVSDVSTRACN